MESKLTLESGMPGSLWGLHRYIQTNAAESLEGVIEQFLSGETKCTSENHTT
jgi:hypothetical protein